MENIYFILITIIVIVCYFFYYPRLTSSHYLSNNNFNVNQYLGKWHEVFRSSNIPFEQNLNYVTATYTKDQEGNLNVLNQGATLKYQNDDLIVQNQQYIKGNAYPTDVPNILLVQFFPLLRSPYVVLYSEDVKDDWRYDYAVVASGDYIWFLSRSDDIPSEILKKMTHVATKAGYDPQMIKKNRIKIN
jgi:apolipoprotein D and lipocalin family protein